MKAIELSAIIDRDHQIRVDLPPDVPAGLARIIVLLPETDDAEKEWERGIAREWRQELADPREDVYSLTDGDPIR